VRQNIKSKQAVEKGSPADRPESIVEGCTQSSHRDWSTGMMEWWSDGFEPQYSNIPLLQDSISFVRLASAIFLISLKSEFFNTL
jgi:hypothetical protein